jgi:transposase
LGVGYDWKIWDIKIVKDFVNNRYNVTFSYSGVWRMVRKRLGFSYGKPYQKDARQDPLKVKIFLEETLPKVAKRIEKLVKEGKKVLVGLEDESHHQIKPNVQRALFKGKSIMVETINLLNEKKTSFGFLSLSGDLFLEYYNTGNAANFIAFCKSLEETYKDYSSIFLFLDNAKYHGNAKFRGSKKVRKYWGKSKIEPVFIPPYSPELNPIEQVWRIIKKQLGKHLFRKISEAADCVFKLIEQKEHQFLSIVSGFAKKHFSRTTLAHYLI